MHSHDENHKAEIAALELQLLQYENLLDQSIKNNEVFAKTKTILHDIKLVTEKCLEAPPESAPHSRAGITIGIPICVVGRTSILGCLWSRACRHLLRS